MKSLFQEMGGDEVEEGVAVGGFFEPEDAILAMNGRLPVADFPPEYTHQGILAHEFGHVLDTDDGYVAHSNTIEFEECFDAEIKDGKLSEYADTDASEGFAEFARLLYGSNQSRKTIAEKYPRALRFFESKGYA